MATKKKTASKSNKSTEQMRKEAIAQADKNIAVIEAKERAPGNEAPLEESKPVRNASASSRKKSSTAAKATKGAKTQQTPTTATKGAELKTPKLKAEKPAKEKKLSGLDHAANVLATSKEPLNATTIAERCIAAGWKTNGATPHATLYAAMIREIQTKGSDSRFKKMDRGLFTVTAKAGK